MHLGSVLVIIFMYFFKKKEWEKKSTELQEQERFFSIQQAFIRYLLYANPPMLVLFTFSLS